MERKNSISPSPEDEFDLIPISKRQKVFDDTEEDPDLERGFEIKAESDLANESVIVTDEDFDDEDEADDGECEEEEDDPENSLRQVALRDFMKNQKETPFRHARYQKALEIGCRIGTSFLPFLKDLTTLQGPGSTGEKFLKHAEQLRSFRATRNHRIGVIGETGAGKSSLITCLLGIAIAKSVSAKNGRR